MAKAIPDRWLNYQPIGQRIPATRFIAFKVPLQQNINERYVKQKEHRLAPHSLLDSIPNLGLIIDLTNTNRYYSPESFIIENVQHQKLMIPGKQTPDAKLAKTFCRYVSNFLEANADNDKVIGVHCTHGVNRTGYMICYYMITRMQMQPEAAIQAFADSRGHRIERENYTTALHLLAGHQVQELRNSNHKNERKSQEWPITYETKNRKLNKNVQDNERSTDVWRNDANSWQVVASKQQQPKSKRENYRNQWHSEQTPRDDGRRYQRYNNTAEFQESYNHNLRNNYHQHDQPHQSNQSYESHNSRANSRRQNYHNFDSNNYHGNNYNHNYNNPYSYGRDHSNSSQSQRRPIYRSKSRNRNNNNNTSQY